MRGRSRSNPVKKKFQNLNRSYSFSAARFVLGGSFGGNLAEVFKTTTTVVQIEMIISVVCGERKRKKDLNGCKLRRR